MMGPIFGRWLPFPPSRIHGFFDEVLGSGGGGGLEAMVSEVAGAPLLVLDS